MRAFSASWLALREPADTAARSVRLARAIASRFRTDQDLRILDLGAGTGANVRFLAEHLPRRQHWTLVDSDALLLHALPRQMTSWASTRGHAVTLEADDLLVCGDHLDCRLTQLPMDLRVGVDDEGLYEAGDVITASALLDLVSEPWLQTLAFHCARRAASVLFALTYDGRIECSPGEPEDDTIRDLVNQHQRTDKGFGPALGPDAVASARTCFTRAGYDVQCDASDWILDPPSSELQRQLVDGWAQAASEIAPERAVTIQSWRTRRLAHVSGGLSRILVGHQDLAAWPT